MEDHRYDDIINLPHHVSSSRPHMPRADRAAQFSPFAALTGHAEVIRETARLTSPRAELSGDAQESLDAELRRLAAAADPARTVRVTWFRPDSRKPGGEYLTATDTVKRVDTADRVLILSGGEVIPLDDLYSIEAMETPPGETDRGPGGD